MHRLFIVIAVVVVASGAGLAVPRDNQPLDDYRVNNICWGKPTRGIRMGLLAEKRSYSTEEPIRLFVLLQNVIESKDPTKVSKIVIPFGGLPDGTGLDFYVRRLDAKGKPQKTVVHKFPPIGPDYVVDKTIVNGLTYIDGFDVKWLGFVGEVSDAKPGRYLLSVGYRPADAQSSSKTAKKWKGETFRSGEVYFEITGRTAP